MTPVNVNGVRSSKLDRPKTTVANINEKWVARPNSFHPPMTKGRTLRKVVKIHAKLYTFSCS